MKAYPNGVEDTDLYLMNVANTSTIETLVDKLDINKKNDILIIQKRF